MSNTISNVDTDQAPTFPIRVTAKTLRGVQGNVLRPAFEPFTLEYPISELPMAVMPNNPEMNGKVDQVMNELWTRALRSIVNSRERAIWENGGKIEDIPEWYASEIAKITVDDLWQELCAPRTRTVSGMTLSDWRSFAANNFMPALIAFRAATNQPALSPATIAATLKVAADGKNMATHNKAVFLKRMGEFLEHPECVELLGALAADAVEYLSKEESRKAASLDI